MTKKGEPELRRLLSNAAMQGRRNRQWQHYYLALREFILLALRKSRCLHLFMSAFFESQNTG